MMRYVSLAAPGSANQLSISRGAIPSPQANEVLIRVFAAGINRPDILQRQGLYPAPGDASPVLGLEVAGEIIACGAEVVRWKLGDSVCALVNGGGYAEYALAPESQCLPVPRGFSWIQAAALPETFFTVWHNLWQRARLTANETLLVHGGSSGIGTSAIQMAVARGIKVFATAATSAKCAACEALGAVAINYREQDFVAVTKTLTQGRGVDVILDMVGGDYIQRNIAAAAKEGRIVNIAYLASSRATVDFMPLMLKRLTLTGSTLRAQSPAVKTTIAAELQEHIWPLLNAGKIAPLIAQVFSLDDVASAHQLMESNQHIGKIVLEIIHE